MKQKCESSVFCGECGNVTNLTFDTDISQTLRINDTLLGSSNLALASKARCAGYMILQLFIGPTFKVLYRYPGLAVHGDGQFSAHCDQNPVGSRGTTAVPNYICWDK